MNGFTWVPSIYDMWAARSIEKERIIARHTKTETKAKAKRHII